MMECQLSLTYMDTLHDVMSAQLKWIPYMMKYQLSLTYVDTLHDGMSSAQLNLYGYLT